MRFQLILVFICLQCGLFAQRYAIETQLQVGRILRHTPKLTFIIPERSWGIFCNYKWQYFDKNDHTVRLRWQQQPEFGLAATYFNLGNDTLGQAWSIVPNIRIPIFSSNNFYTDFQLGTGIAFITNPYNELQNPQNNAIGSHFNNTTFFQLLFNYRYSEKLLFHAGASLTHYSNGGMQLPNFGLNISTINFGAQYLVVKKNIPEKYLTQQVARQNRWGGMAQGGIALRELIGIGGPKYPYYIAAFATTFETFREQKIYLGGEYEFSKGVYAFGLYNRNFGDEAAARRGASRYSAFLGYEWRVRRVGIFLQTGYYINHQTAFLLPTFYNKLNLRYYLPLQKNICLFTGISLKAHAITAEHISLCGGVSF
ncbi:MAG: acyloxyacyl hydrolase [Saprospiraceae bacterium]|nr:acyloxyacyl hydrolase [Saprospiraceae bacterium]MBP7699679.1 acyloxyacyl hydrolase [Saprospiraceae bacterium]